MINIWKQKEILWVGKQNGNGQETNENNLITECDISDDALW